ncbi:hypothetical protein EV183_000512 [Coemansia sp. RSA 2336]|nr:hypothetical protein EV183_000512 [Coemansia sp. RSA 2336]
MTNYSKGSGKHENEPSAYKPADNPLPRYVVSDMREGGSSENSQYSGQGRDSSLAGGMAAMSSPSTQERSSVIEMIHMAQRVDPRTLPPPDPFLQQFHPQLRNSFMQHLVVHTTLWNENKEEELTVVELPHNSNSKRISAAAKSRKRGVTQFGQLKVEPGLEIENNLLGDHAATSMVVEDERGERGMSDPQPMMVPKCLSTVFSDAFDVYSIKTFPGMIESTPLSRALAQQGLKIPIRNTQDSG